jgi:ferredoxin
VGLGGFLLTPEFGTRQRFAFVLTDAELEGDAVRGKTICGDCGGCAAACPYGAIHLDRTQAVSVEGHAMPVAQVDIGLCASCPNGAFLAAGRGKEPDRIAAACGRECLVRLERRGKSEQRLRKQIPQARAVAAGRFQAPDDARRVGGYEGGRGRMRQVRRHGRGLGACDRTGVFEIDG